jgi:HD superfamily phosphohydrolase YqeK
MYIDLERAKEEFIKYVKTFDLKDSMIVLKLNHSLRVMEVSKTLAKRMRLNEEDTEIAAIIGLLHDLARFEQYTQYKTFRDLDSKDHGDWAVEILEKDMRKYVETDKYDDLTKVAIRNHNKLEIEPNLDERKLFFCKLIRDADKLDIFFEAAFIFWDESIDEVNNSELAKEVYEQFCNHQLVKRVKDKKYINYDSVIVTVAFIFNIYFKESFEYLHEQNYINIILDKFDYKDKKIAKNIKKIANDYIKEEVGMI